MSLEIVKKYVNDRFLPTSEQNVKVSVLWDNRYRVNVWSYEPTKIVASYFIRLNSDNEVEYCNPIL